MRAIGRTAAATALALVLTGGTAAAQKAGGVLRVHLWDSPPNLSVLEGVNPLAARTLIPVFNNLVMFDQQGELMMGSSGAASIPTGSAKIIGQPRVPTAAREDQRNGR